MALILAITSEQQAGETRVAATPDTVKKWAAAGLTVKVQAGAGLGASIGDDAFAAAGATIAGTAGEALGNADLVLKVRGPAADEIKAMKPGAVVVAMLDAYRETAMLKALAAANITAYAMEFVPRITRAQALSLIHI